MDLPIDKYAHRLVLVWRQCQLAERLSMVAVAIGLATTISLYVYFMVWPSWRYQLASSPVLGHIVYEFVCLLPPSSLSAAI
jgi:hypothetical protein